MGLGFSCALQKRSNYTMTYASGSPEAILKLGGKEGTSSFEDVHTRSALFIFYTPPLL